jgi:hypothetical protein
MNNVAGVLDLVPDEPRWVEARGMLLSGRGIVRWAGEHGALLYAPEDAVVSVVGAVPTAELRALLAGVPRATVALIAPEHRNMLGQFAGWTDQRAIIHVLGARPASEWPSDVTLFGPDDAPRLEHLPDRLRRDLLRALAFGSVAAAWCDELPVSFANPVWETETLYDVSIDTLEAYRGRGLGGRSVNALMTAMAERVMMPVWGALEVNAASLRLARRLGFTPVAELVVMSQNIGCAGIANDPAGVDRDNSLSARASEVCVVRGDNERPSLAYQPLERARELAAAAGIERGCRLVHQQQRWIHGECSGDGYSLRLAARQFMWKRVGLTADAQRRQQLAGASLSLGPRQTLHVNGRERDVAQGAHVSEEMMELKHHSDAAVQLHQPLSPRQPVGHETYAVHVDAAGREWLQSGNCPQDRRFSGARCAHQRNQLAPIDGKGKVMDDEPRSATNLEMADRQNGGHACFHPFSIRRASRASGNDSAR